MPAPLAAPSDVERRWRALSEAEIPRIETFIEDASAMVRRKYPTIDTRITAGTVAAQEVAGVIARIVIRGLKNPEGLKWEATGGVSVTYDTRVSAGYLYLAPEDIEILRVPRSWPRGAIRVVPDMRPYDASIADVGWS